MSEYATKNIELYAKDEEIARLKAQLTRAADALRSMHLNDGIIQPHPDCHWCRLIAQLRKAAE